MKKETKTYNRLKIMMVIALSFIIYHLTISPAGAQPYQTFPQQMERLDRGVVALPAQEQGNFVSWRLLGTDAKGTTFDLQRDGKTIAKGLSVTNFTDVKGSTSSRYSVIAKLRDNVISTSAETTPWADLYRSVPLDRPNDSTTPDGRPYRYTPNDCSVGDVDGDGRYELFLKWDPSNAHDNSHDGYTGDVIIDCLNLDGTKLWRINLGKNIRAGAHYTQFMVYDFDRDGHAELICKTAPGSIDGTGRYVTEAADDAEIRKADNQADYRNERGRILSGPEYLTVFDGLSGRAVHTIYYRPNRAFGVGGSALYDKEGWGDRGTAGNRGERFLAGVAWLDGPQGKPSAVMCRGYYTPSHLWAVDFDGQKLSTRWLHASTTPNDYYVIDRQGRQTWYHDLKATAYGQGAHSLSVGDVDGDGCDEITYGSAAIDNDGRLLYSTGLGHGDALHLSDLDPDRPGLEVFMVHESRPYGADLRDARTGERLWYETARDDTGRGVAADIDGRHRGFEFWHIFNRAVHNIKGDVISNNLPSCNFRIYWDGDLQDELLANRGRPYFGSFVEKWNGEKAVPLPLTSHSSLITSHLANAHFYDLAHSASCNWTKATPCLQADLFGDWREEVILWDASDAAHLNIFTTNIPTSYAVPTLMHDNIYRLSICWQNTAYNQPPHLGYYLPDYVSSQSTK
jgi:rhamnogalacturonan endolyase